MNYFFKDGNAYIEKDGSLSLEKTFDCGQTFRFEKDGSLFKGVALNRELTLKDEEEHIILYNTEPEEFKRLWVRYFDLERDYASINKKLAKDEFISKILDISKGIRILKQDEWEVICSFIISQNNNIPRIKKIINTLCESFGDKLPNGYTFPSPEKLLSVGAEGLSVIRSGFRAKYIIDAAEKIKSGQINFEDIYKMDLEAAKIKLMEIKGVGDKVASCVLLFGFGFMDSFPKDVWIKKVMEKYYKENFDIAKFQGCAGVAQQYLFYYERYINNKR
ncbi:DNA-3-methyladenine glycosylase 2 family protein [Eubacteriales bacterium OttesenSCG-928-G02]|nr:DNA-3-methyladenine glycosylase 2 family protein [Eubacteriales bacterium OttesenSCG-928-G02]